MQIFLKNSDRLAEIKRWVKNLSEIFLGERPNFFGWGGLREKFCGDEMLVFFSLQSKNKLELIASACDASLYQTPNFWRTMTFCPETILSE